MPFCSTVPCPRTLPSIVPRVGVLDARSVCLVNDCTTSIVWATGVSRLDHVSASTASIVKPGGGNPAIGCEQSQSGPCFDGQRRGIQPQARQGQMRLTQTPVMVLAGLHSLRSVLFRAFDISCGLVVSSPFRFMLLVIGSTEPSSGNQASVWSNGSGQFGRVRCCRGRGPIRASEPHGH